MSSECACAAAVLSSLWYKQHHARLVHLPAALPSSIVSRINPVPSVHLLPPTAVSAPCASETRTPDLFGGRPQPQPRGADASFGVASRQLQRSTTCQCVRSWSCYIPLVGEGGLGFSKKRGKCKKHLLYPLYPIRGFCAF